MDLEDPGDAAGLTADDFCALLDLDEAEEGEKDLDEAEEEEEDESVFQEELRRRLLGDLPAGEDGMEVEEAGFAAGVEEQAPEGSATEEEDAPQDAYPEPPKATEATEAEPAANVAAAVAPLAEHVAEVKAPVAAPFPGADDMSASDGEAEQDDGDDSTTEGDSAAEEGGALAQQSAVAQQSSASLGRIAQPPQEDASCNALAGAATGFAERGADEENEFFDGMSAEPAVGVADVAPVDDEEEVDLDARSSELARFLASSVCGEVGLSYRVLIKHLGAHTRAAANGAAAPVAPRQPRAAVEAPAFASSWVEAWSSSAPLPASRGPVSVKLKVPAAKPLVMQSVHRRPKAAPVGPTPLVVLDEGDQREKAATGSLGSTEATTYSAIPIPKAMEEGLERLRRKLAERR